MSERGVCRHCGRKGRFYPPMPEGYIAASEWAERKMSTHHQEPCPDCGRLTIWKRDGTTEHRVKWESDARLTVDYGDEG